MPNLSNFSYVTNASHGDVPSLGIAGGALLYALAYAAVLLVITVTVFNRRNFK